MNDITIESTYYRMMKYKDVTVIINHGIFIYLNPPPLNIFCSFFHLPVVWWSNLRGKNILLRLLGWFNLFLFVYYSLNKCLLKISTVIIFGNIKGTKHEWPRDIVFRTGQTLKNAFYNKKKGDRRSKYHYYTIEEKGYI